MNEASKKMEKIYLDSLSIRDILQNISDALKKCQEQEETDSRLSHKQALEFANQLYEVKTSNLFFHQELTYIIEELFNCETGPVSEATLNLFNSFVEYFNNILACFRTAAFKDLTESSCSCGCGGNCKCGGDCHCGNHA